VAPGRSWRGGERRRWPAVEKQSRGAEHVPKEEEEGRGSEGPRWNLQKRQGLLYKLYFPTDLKL
jgi:hypothetical protein